MVRDPSHRNCDPSSMPGLDDYNWQRSVLDVIGNLLPIKQNTLSKLSKTIGKEKTKLPIFNDLILF